MTTGRILLVSNEFPPAVGGVSTLLHELATRLYDRVTVLALDHPGAASFDNNQLYEVHRVQAEMRHVPLTREFTWAGRAELNKGGYDVVLCGHIDLLMAALRLRGPQRPPIAFMSYGMEIAGMPGGLKGWMMRRWLRKPDLHLTISRYTQGLLESKGVAADRIVRYPLGADLERFRPDLDTSELRARLQPGDGPILLSVGRLVKRKGHDTLIEAMPLILERHPGAVLYFAGDGPLRAQHETDIRRAGLSDRIRMLGEVDETDLPLLYSMADLFVLPVRRIHADVEGFGLVFLEAMACGCPVVAGNSGGVPDAVPPDCGVLVDPMNPAAIANEVSALLADPTRRKALRDAGLRWVRETMTWDNCADAVSHALLNISNRQGHDGIA